ncbi:[protein-PII] uridylyltransferase [Ectothiorhodospira variabilis]|uniref:[protein-PII] uridylyltransferase n=1 Tax=Ectothiorhodospira variabilis TaxID=505694 RepID=UPI001EFB2AB1|nr:[protein-PII] uridylyltransferase [Ectothiorhodospira variabilis]MCG5493911.1 [protein-PII] uridylyltransferase [Ectothiorhodospira variabilis]MCG5498125.1 [protein-PII] uridylyltransferase [Ectothiorhodospira variabilis]MCG5503714.1 [protein-PII] uridylyltransferase [Ectothiorhodospira variabilis]MCG5506870.1 [protein-PII] uridylyltransferase [Ectothiorhodospira variabilis]
MSALRPLPESIQQRLDWESQEQRLRAHSPPDKQTYVDALNHVRLTLETAFAEGCDVTDLVQARAATMDRLLISAWAGMALDQEETLGLAAVGGYGRGDLHPGSDVDILILFQNGISPGIEERLGAFVTFLWDIGLELGHSVRNLEDCSREAAADITVATNLLESRPLTGPESLFSELESRINPERMWNSRAFFCAKLDEQEARHQRFGETAYRLEPNLKESPGGLRDIQMIGWVTQRHFGSSALAELVAHGFLTQAEYHDLMDGQAFLWRVRFALHMLSGRKEDRLLFDYQRRLANLLGFSDHDHNLAVEQFMQQYFRTVMELERLNEMLLQHFSEAILLDETDDDIVPINRRFQARRGFLEITHPRVFRQYPPALLEVFLLLQQHPDLKGIRASTIREIRCHRGLIDDNFRQDLACRSLFMEILRQPHGVTEQLRRMNRYGVLAAYLPAFALIVGRMQYDLFHVFTVDEHTLAVIRNLRRFASSEHDEELPECSRLFRRIPKPELLYLAGLFHDIAKGRGGDHSELGAEEAREFCLRHGLALYDANLVGWLVRAHLLMSLTAQRRDISDPDVIMEFASQVGNTMRLNYLYLLTVADIRGTNPKLWNSWKNSLLNNLYASTQRMLRRGLDNPPDQDELVGEVQTHALELLKSRGVDEEHCFAIWNDFDVDYFLRHSADEIAWHTRAIHEVDEEDLPLVQVRQETARGSTEIFLYTEDHPHLFALTSTALTQLGLDIVDARIITTSSHRTLDTFLVLEDTGQPIDNPFRVQEIGRLLKERLKEPDRRPNMVRRSTPRQLKHFDVPTEVSFAPHTHHLRTVLKISTADRPGLLSRIGIILTDCQVKVHNAKIATAGEQADDVFYISNLDDTPISDPERQALIASRLREALEIGATDPPPRELAV